ncbi:MAG TPA: cation transporter [Planctomycetes bacterium]|nr:cation transporter [Planctomycetota bacterium]HIK60783.1 cation transporter [Planctomycetota bacterium]
MKGRTPKHQARGSRVHFIGLGVNMALAAIKLLGGLWAGSPALLADGVHSLSDGVTSLAGLLSFRWAGKPADEDHHYGHGKAEALAAALVGLVLVTAGVLLIIDAMVGEDPRYEERSKGILAMSIAGVSAVVNAWLHRLAASTGRDLQSPSLMALARDCYSDALASGLVIIGVGCSMANLPRAENLAAGVIGGLILLMGLKTLRGATDILMDRVPDPNLRADITATVNLVEGVEGVERVGIHPLGHQLRVDMEISVDGDLSVRQGHVIAHKVEESIIASETRVVEVAVHVNPKDSSSHQ